MARGQKRRGDVPRTRDEKISRASADVRLAIHCLERALEAVAAGRAAEVRERLDGASYFIGKLDDAYPRPRAKTGT